MDATIAYSMSETTLGQEMRKKRGERSLRKMAELSGIDFSILARIENGRIVMPSRDTLAAISRGYDMPMEHAALLVYCGKSA